MKQTKPPEGLKQTNKDTKKMPIRMIPDLLKSGDKPLGLPRKDVYHRLVGQIGTALPHEEQPYAYPHTRPKRKN